MDTDKSEEFFAALAMRVMGNHVECAKTLGLDPNLPVIWTIDQISYDMGLDRVKVHCSRCRHNVEAVRVWVEGRLENGQV